MIGHAHLPHSIVYLPGSPLWTYHLPLETLILIGRVPGGDPKSDFCNDHFLCSPLIPTEYNRSYPLAQVEERVPGLVACKNTFFVHAQLVEWHVYDRFA